MPNDSEVVALVAYAEVTGGNPPSFLLNRGFNPAITRNGAGDYSFTLETNEGLTDANKQVFVTVKGTVPMNVAVEDVDASTIRVRTAIHDGTATDAGYSIKVKRPTNTFSS